MGGILAAWREDIWLLCSGSWWKRFAFFVWRRLQNVWYSWVFWGAVFAMLAVSMLRIYTAGEIYINEVGPYADIPINVSLISSLVEAFYGLVLLLIVRVSIYPPKASFLPRFFVDRGLWVSLVIIGIQLLYWVFFIVFPIWPLFCLWMLMVADSPEKNGFVLFGSSLVRSIRLLLRHGPMTFLLMVFPLFLFAIAHGYAVLVYAVVLPTMFAVAAVLYTLWQEGVA